MVERIGTYHWISENATAWDMHYAFNFDDFYDYGKIKIQRYVSNLISPQIFIPN
jgi:hypothetical protein